MQKVLKRKEELSFLINELTANEPVKSTLSEASVRYFDSFLLLTRQEKKANVHTFLNDYLKILKTRSLPKYKE